MKTSFAAPRKSFIAHQLIALSVIFTLALPVFSAEIEKITVNGMVCAFCAQGIEKTLAAMPETHAVYVNLKQRVVLVEPKLGQKLDVAKIRTGITDAGYDVVKTQTLANTSVEAAKAEFKGKK
jgi:cation transport ATPase